MVNRQEIEEAIADKVVESSPAPDLVSREAAMATLAEYPEDALLQRAVALNIAIEHECDLPRRMQIVDREGFIAFLEEWDLRPKREDAHLIEVAHSYGSYFVHLAMKKGLIEVAPTEMTWEFDRFTLVAKRSADGLFLYAIDDGEEPERVGLDKAELAEIIGVEL